MNESHHQCEIKLTPFDNERLINLCGRFDEHLRQIERSLGVTLSLRGNLCHIHGPGDAVKRAAHALEGLYVLTARDQLDPSHVHLALVQGPAPFAENDEEPASHVGIRTPLGVIKPRTVNQQRYVQRIGAHDINFGIGPAGTGKTYLAVACAVRALEAERVRRILLVRPAVEAGEHLGFLPGDLAQKIDPYLRPLYDALYEMLGFERVARLLERQIIEIAPLAYMRGRTLNDAFIILDESQNTTPEQMKMFLTRVGFNSTTVITGDVTQVDLPRGRACGLKQVISILKGIEQISFTHFDSQDVVRHPIVQKIVEAYERFEEIPDNRGFSE